jgi:hypothetical protein
MFLLNTMLKLINLIEIFLLDLVNLLYANII